MSELEMNVAQKGEELASSRQKKATAETEAKAEERKYAEAFGAQDEKLQAELARKCKDIAEAVAKAEDLARQLGQDTVSASSAHIPELERASDKEGGMKMDFDPVDRKNLQENQSTASTSSAHTPELERASGKESGLKMDFDTADHKNHQENQKRLVEDLEKRWKAKQEAEKERKEKFLEAILGGFEALDEYEQEDRQKYLEELQAYVEVATAGEEDTPGEGALAGPLRGPEQGTFQTDFRNS
jgi:hypothetical protein